MVLNFEEVYKILKRISDEYIFDYRLPIIFDNRELSIIKLLYEQNCIFNSFNKTTAINRVALTNKGKMYVFSVEHKKELNDFKSALVCLGYNPSFIFDFLLSRDFSKGVENILSFKEYEDYLEEKEEELQEALNIKIKEKNMPK